MEAPPDDDAIATEVAWWRKALSAGRRGQAIPARTEASSGHFVLGTGLLAVLAIANRIARRGRVPRLAAAIARARTRLDGHFYEPNACGLNSALTELGLALLTTGDVAGAVVALDRSGRVYPCPHSLSFGLRQDLAVALASYPQATDALARYRKRSDQFRDVQQTA
jgi:hypothetical protein